MVSVFSWPYSRRYYLTHPWKWFSHLWKIIKSVWQRATRGYCDTDVWNMAYWMLEILPPMLCDLANDKIGAYPGTEPFETPEKWNLWLRSMAAKFLELRDDWPETRNEYEDEYLRIADEARVIKKQEDGMVRCNFIFKDEEYAKELRDKWFSRMKELRDAQNAATVAAFSELAKHFYLLWS